MSFLKPAQVANLLPGGMGLRPLKVVRRAEVIVVRRAEVIADKNGFGGLSPKILFYKSVTSFKTFYDIVKAVVEAKDIEIYF